MTRQMVAVVVDVDGTALIDVLPEESATKPIGATRVAYDADAQTKTVLAVQPIEEAIAADEIAIKGR
jgi:hypothetical protein